MPFRKTPPEINDGTVTPNQRRRIYFDYGINLPSAIALLVAIGSMVGYLMQQSALISANTKDIQAVRMAQELVDRGIIDHARMVEEVAIRDRAEMREDIKEIKSTVKDIAVVQRKGR